MTVLFLIAFLVLLPAAAAVLFHALSRAPLADPSVAESWGFGIPEDFPHESR